jgi:hypothetical protein
MNEQIIVPEQLVKEKIMDSIPKVLEEMFSRSYSNPVKDAIEQSIKEKD